MHGNRYGSICILQPFDVHIMLGPFAEYAFYIPFYIFSFFVKNWVSVGVWIDIRVFNSISLVLLSVFMPIPGCFSIVAL